MVAVGFPETGLVLEPELKAARPLGALPEVEVRDEQARRATVLRVELLVVVLECDPCLSVADVVQRTINKSDSTSEDDVSRWLLGVKRCSAWLTTLDPSTITLSTE